MTTSNSVDFSVNRDEIIKGALRVAQVIGKDSTPDANHITTGSEALNMIVKQWQGNADFGANLKVWSRKTAYLFPQQGQSVYSLGPSGDHWTASYSSTTVSAAEAAGQTTISVTSTTGMTAADNIGIVLDSGLVHWTTIVSTGAGPTVVITAALASVAASGNRVFWYTSKGRRPLSLITAVLRTTDTKDTTLMIGKREDYEALPDKTGDGDPIWVAYEATLTNGTLYLSSEPSDVTKVIRIVFLGTLEDFDAISDTPDYPQEWYRPLKFQLALDIWGEYKKTDQLLLAWIKAQRDESLGIAQNTNPETSDAFFEPGRE